MAAFRQALLATRAGHNDLVTAIQAYLEAQATQASIRLDALDQSAIAGGAGGAGAAPAASREAQAVAALPARQRAVIEVLLSPPTTPAWWDTPQSDRRRQRWLQAQRRRIERARRRIEATSTDAAYALVADELRADAHVIAIGLSKSDILAYIHDGRFNRFAEDRNAWNRVALRHNTELHGPDDGGTPRTLDEAIGSAAEAEGGWELSRIEYDRFTRDYIAANPEATDEQVVRAAAAHNGRSPEYPGRIWAHFQRIRATAAAPIAPATP